MRPVRLSVSALLILTAACSSSRSGTCADNPAADCVVVSPKLPAACSKSAVSRMVDEAALTARIDGSNLDVTLPLGSLGCDVAGSARLSLIDALATPESEVAAQTHTFSMGASGTTVGFTLAARWSATPSAGELARYVLGYDVAGSFGEIRGRRSLFEAVPSVAATLLAPNAMPGGSPAEARIAVRNPGSGEPIAGATVEVDAQPKDGAATSLWTGATDADGEALARFWAPSDVADGTNLVVNVSAADGTATLSSPLVVTHDRQILLTTDKPLYQPGQTMHLRTLTLKRPQLLPDANEPEIIEIQDGKGNKVARLHLTTDAFGVAATDFALASEVNMGGWTVRATVGDSSVEKQVKVDQYSLPKFQVTLSTAADSVAPGADLHGTVSAQYFFGKPVANGSVEVTASSAGTDFAQVDGTTNGSGLYAFDVTVPSGTTGQVSLTASVADATGHPQTGTATLPVASGPLAVTILPENGKVAVGLENHVYVSVTDPAGKPVSAKVNVTAPGLDANLTTDAHGVATALWTPQKPGDTLTATATDANGHSASATASADPTAPELVLHTDRAAYKAGDTAHVVALVPASVTNIAFDIIREGATATAGSAKVSGGHTSFDVPLDAEMTGALQIDASYQAATGVVHASQAIYVDPQNDLDLQVTLSDPTGASRTQYRPGEEARVRFTVKDQEGTPKVAALGVTAVDQAVYALTDAKAQNPQLYFDLGGALSANASAAGFSSSDLFNGDARDEAARLLFAASPAPPGLSVQLDSETAVVQTALSTFAPREAVDQNALVNLLRTASESGQITYDNFRTVAPRVVSTFVDAFGEPYAGTVDASQWNLTVTSRGFDERAGTADDYSMSLPVWEFLWYGGGQYGGPPMDAAGGERNDKGTAAGGSPAPTPGGTSSAPRVRSWFPETLVSDPDVITDASGTAEISVPIADSITTWQMATVASSADGDVGSASTAIPVYQQFFADTTLPPTITRGDEIVVPVSVHNYLTTPQNVTLTVLPAAWFTLDDTASKSLTLAPDEVQAATFRLRATEVGVQALTIDALGQTQSDAVRRTLEVKPDGDPIAATVSGKLAGPVSHPFTVPSGAIPGATSITVKIYPGVLSQAVAGLDSMLAMPEGCMEQTTSTAWPNVMVMEYLRASGQSTPEIEKKALGYIQAGYQRILTFQKADGGFGWWPDPTEKSNRTVTAIGLMELYDTSKIIDVDPAVLQRAQAFLDAAQQQDGSWPAGDALHMGDEVLGDNPARATAFIAWALARVGDTTGAVDRAFNYLRSQEATLSPYEKALAANAFLAHDPNDSDGQRLAQDLNADKTSDTKGVRWQLDTPTWTGATGDVGAVEATGLATTALLEANAYPDDVNSAVTWLESMKDDMGNWYNTQATVNALRALIDSLSPQQSNVNAQITVSIDGAPVQTLAVTPADSDLVRTIDLSSFASAGTHTVSVDFAGTGSLYYQMVERHYLPATPTEGTLALNVAWDHTQVKLGDSPLVTAMLTNLAQGPVDQAIVEVALPPDFTPDTDELNALVTNGIASRWEMGPNLVRFYLMNVAPNQPRQIAFHAQAGLAGSLNAEASHAWLYYQPSVRAAANPVSFTVAP